MLTSRTSSALAILAAALVLSACGGGDRQTEANAQSASRMKALAVSPPSGLTVVSLTKVSETRVSRTIYDYVFKIAVQNDSVPRTAIMATATGGGQGTTIIDGSVHIGDIAAGSLFIPADTFTIRQDRTYGFNAAALTWQITEPINGIAVPPEPDPVANNATLAGVDSNGNDVRDDVERQIAAQIIVANDFPFAIAYAKAYQDLITSVSPSDRLSAIAKYTNVFCAAKKSSPAVRDIDMRLLISNNPLRNAALRGFFNTMILVDPEEMQTC